MLAVQTSAGTFVVATLDLADAVLALFPTTPVHGADATAAAWDEADAWDLMSDPHFGL